MVTVSFSFGSLAVFLHPAAQIMQMTIARIIKFCDFFIFVSLSIDLPHKKSLLQSGKTANLFSLLLEVCIFLGTIK